MRWFALLSMVNIAAAAAAAAAILGIDYGTEFVKSSLVAPNAPFEIVLTPDSQRKDASGLVIKPTDGERYYGSGGVSLVPKFPDSSFYGIKGLLGLPYTDLRVGLYEEMHPGVAIVPTDRKTVGFNVSGTVIPVEEIVAMQLNDVIGRATAMVQEKTHSKTATLRDIALSVPGRFGSSQRQALVDAVGLAGSELVGLVSDGVAVAVNYANSPAVSSKLTSEKHYVVVYDVGASAASSTLVSLSVRPEDESIVDVAVEGFGSNIELSGQALTTLLREMLLQRFTEGYKNVERTPRLLNRLWREAERAKQVLSANTEAYVHVESLVDDADLSTKITRKEFETAASYQIGKVVEPLRDSLSGFEGEVDAVVLVGGATRTPFVMDQLKSEVGEAKLSKNVNADEANVQGACMRGVNLSGVYRSKKKFEVSDIVSHDYTLHINSKAGKENKKLFSIGESLGSKVVIDLPRNVTQLEVYEDRKKLVSWELPYIQQNIDSLHEPGPYTCIDKSRLQATFIIDNNGVLRLIGVDAVCNSIKTPTTSSANESSTSTETNVTDPDTSATGSSSTDTDSSTSGSNSTASSTSSSTSEETASRTTNTGTTSEIPRPKTRRVSVQASWEQAPIGPTERGNIRKHLDAMNKNDRDRKHYSLLHHELESLVYRIKGMVSDGKHELTDTAERLLSWIEGSSNGGLDELKKNLKEAREIYQRETESTASNAENTETDSESDPEEDNEQQVAHDEL